MCAPVGVCLSFLSFVSVLSSPVSRDLAVSLSYVFYRVPLACVYGPCLYKYACPLHCTFKFCLCVYVTYVRVYVNTRREYVETGTCAQALAPVFAFVCALD